MAQAIDFDTIATQDAMEKKAYTLNIKGLIAHAFDVLFTRQESVQGAGKTYQVSHLPVHLQKDIGLIR
ncbi:hypothetical protein KDD30_20090 (plasmid) [Photobacterium sp. GJ3]|uniref:hypothetical protein n=1 Tax=Photobacterium sp. GJ3 TaxID=2829502 RepID=UPI001B8CF717|nr:hypothetical protein [Photobacterium sp. GJ3]QUJ70408.1 hypothetical protein KDD30_20090 [Photobacterium sp. GJ3]